MTRRFFITILSAIVLVGAGCAPSNLSRSNTTTPPTPASVTTPTEKLLKTWVFQGQLPDDKIKGKVVKMETDKGTIVFEIFGDTAPITVSNFVYLTEGGYYDGLKFHRREEGFVIQGGDPNGNGTGGPGYKFQDELKDSYSYKRGIVAMANAGPNTNGSQFFVMLADVPLPKNYSIFGRVLTGMDVVDKIQVGDRMTHVTIENKK